MKRVLTLLFVALLTCGTALAEPEAEGAKPLPAKTYQFKFKAVDRAAAIIKPLLSADGSVSMQGNALTVTDHPANLAAISTALMDYDVAPRELRLSIRLVMAGRGETAKVNDEVRDVAPKLRMLGFNSVESLGQADIEGHEGEPAAVELANGYRAEFRFGEYDSVTRSISINDLRLSRLEGSEKEQQVKDLYKTTLNLKIGQTLIFATTKKGDKAVVVVLAARR